MTGLRRLSALIAAIVLAAGGPARSCDTALLLAVDVSNSVDEAEYRLQIDGMADALLDPEIVAALIEGQVRLSVMQWSGVERQVISLPWTQMRSRADIARFSQQARALERAFILSDTAPAEAIRFALRQFDEVGDCARHIIDVSGDGTPNSGSDTRGASREAERSGVTINGIAIESMGLAISGFYRRALITRDGFVITARGHRDYPRAIRIKILREVSRVVG